MIKCKLFFLVVAIATLWSCNSQEKVMKNISCAGNVTLQYDRIKSGDSGKPKANKDLNSFTVYFISTYNDKITADVNGKIIFEKQVIRDSNADDLNDYFIYDYSKEDKTPILKITSALDSSCFDIRIDKKYKLIYIFKEGKNWTARYSNIYYVN